MARLERIISGLGSLPAHGPPLLAWTLSTYLARGAEGLGKAARLGKPSMWRYRYRLYRTNQHRTGTVIDSG